MSLAQLPQSVMLTNWVDKSSDMVPYNRVWVMADISMFDPEMIVWLDETTSDHRSIFTNS